MKRWMLMSYAAALSLAVASSAGAVGLPHYVGPGPIQDNFEYVAPPHIVYVNVDPAGPYDSGTRLLEAVDPSNLAPIGGWPKPDNRYLIVVRPGDYDLADRMLRLPPYVHILGSGIGVTQIWSKGEVAIAAYGDSSIRSLSVIQQGSDVQYSLLLKFETEGPFLMEHVQVRNEWAKKAWGLYAEGGAENKVLLHDVRFDVTAYEQATGLEAHYKVSVEANGATFNAVAERVAIGALLNTAKTGESYFVASTLAAKAEKPYVIVTEKNFDSTVRIHASTLRGEKIFANLQGAGRVLVGTTEMTGPYYQSSGSTYVQCVHVFDHDFNDLGGCIWTP